MYEPNEPTVATDKDGKKVLKFKNLADYAAYLKKKRKRRSNFVEDARRGSGDDAQALADYAEDFYANRLAPSSGNFQTCADPSPNDGVGISFRR